jgi:hypothetical protein
LPATSARQNPANDIDRWFERTARQGNRTVSLYACLLTGRIFAYCRYRLRYALLMDTARFVIHVAEFLIILTSLGGLAAFTVMILRMGSLVVSGAWWGLLEVMRERLRALSLSADREAVEREIGSWLVLSVLMGVAATVAGAVALALLLPADHDPIGHFYAFLVVIELALRLPVRVLHSGMYATRRIYRPLWSMFAPTAVQLVIIGAGVFLYPAGAVIVAIIATNAIGIWITVRYTMAVYRLTGLRPRIGRPGGSRRPRLPSIPVRLGVETTLAGLGLRLDAVAVLAIAGIYGTSTRAFDLTAGFSAWRDIDAFQFFYLALPLLRGAYEATGVFYFDFVRLRRLPALHDLRVMFFHKLLWTAPVVSLCYWTLALALGLFVLPDIPVSFLLALLPLFVVRGLIGVYQIRMFAEGQFLALNLTIVLSAGLFWLVWIDVNPASDLVQITAAMIALLIVHINIQHLRDRTPALPTLLSLADWLRTLGREPGPVRMGTIDIPEWNSTRQRTATIASLQRHLHGEGHFAFRSAVKVVLYERVSDSNRDGRGHLALQAATGGAATRGRFLRQPLRTGDDALTRLGGERWLLPVGDLSALPATVEPLTTAFRALFPDGFFFDTETADGATGMRELGPDVLAGILMTALRGTESGAHLVAMSGRWMTPISFGGRLRLIFILPPDAEADRVDSWRRNLRDWQVGRQSPVAVSHAAHD